LAPDYDLDHFKWVNSQYVHLVGDVVHRAIADTIRADIRSYDIAERFGEEEFVVLLPSASRIDAVIPPPRTPKVTG
jgi:diguanylate cyclase (GGDEF)-like protein